MPNTSLDQYDKFFLDHLQSISSSQNRYYYNQRYLGRGANGTAFLVTCSSGPHLGIQMVLKVFHRVSNSSRRKAFLKEVRYLRELSHPAIIQVFDEGEFKTTKAIYPFSVIEYVPSTARQLLAARRIARLQALRIGLNCLSALSYMHALPKPLIHRDLKPENILIGQAGAKLADFGLVKSIASDDAPLAPEELASQWPGMPFRYRTPELIAKAAGHGKEVTCASDIYQIGTVLHELLTGYNPQKPSSDILEPIKIDLRPIAGSQGNELTGLIKQMLRRNPQDRPSAEKALKRLDLIHNRFCEKLASAAGEDV
jgi:eukaryotic-like serine/threonine-protein kinase